ncbi:hypothetical protein ACPUEK_10905 [Marinomonas gallaica]|uniref:hypothetical protein n=1 Tax=Marinomonas gallaica TaxID=1806667 RepID=UPI003CE5B210
MIRANVTNLPQCIDTKVQIYRHLYKDDIRMSGFSNRDHLETLITFQDRPSSLTGGELRTKRLLMESPAALHVLNIFPLNKRKNVRAEAFTTVSSNESLEDVKTLNEVSRVIEKIEHYTFKYEERLKPAQYEEPLIRTHFESRLFKGKLLNGRHAFESLDEFTNLLLGGMALEMIAWTTVADRNVIDQGLGESTALEHLNADKFFKTYLIINPFSNPFEQL